MKIKDPHSIIERIKAGEITFEELVKRTRKSKTTSIRMSKELYYGIMNYLDELKAQGIHFSGINDFIVKLLAAILISAAEDKIYVDDYRRIFINIDFWNVPAGTQMPFEDRKIDVKKLNEVETGKYQEVNALLNKARSLLNIMKSLGNHKSDSKKRALKLYYDKIEEVLGKMNEMLAGDDSIQAELIRKKMEIIRNSAQSLLEGIKAFF